MSLGVRSTRTLGVALAVCMGAGLLAAPALGAQPGAPSLRLVRSEGHVNLKSIGRRVPLKLGVYVASDNGAFELRASRRGYRSPIEARQVDAATGEAIRGVPSRLLDDWNGLDGFIRVRFLRHHRVAASDSFTFCPNRPDSQLQRVDELGPSRPTYPSLCGSSRFPFTKGMVWGLDRGWAAPALAGPAPPFVGEYFRGQRPVTMRVPPGKYSVRVDIAKRYRRLFDIRAKQAAVRLTARVKCRRRGHFIPPPVAVTQAPAGEEDVPTVTTPDPSTLPDLAALPAWSIFAWSRGGHDQLVFASTEWNAGPGPLVVEGFRTSTKPVMAAYQYFYDSDGNVVGRAPVGRLHYDRRRGHHHWHFEQFARYMLVDASGKHSARSHKQSFCIAPSNPIDLTLPGASCSPS